MSSAKVECRKFSPNIFNKSKCQHCFASKDSHSAEALDSNRETRRVSKCGYLFVAPDWDFSNPINRTKRWQRRWFVLYDDGELTYSVDEHPETVPQAIIDMTKVLEVSDAENVTGNQFSLAITAPEKVHFVKGTSREESRWWFDVLSIFPRSTKGSRHKRNATFPGGKATTINEPLDASTKSKELHRSPSVSASIRQRPGSCYTPVMGKSNSAVTWPLPREKFTVEKELLPDKIVVVEQAVPDVGSNDEPNEEAKTSNTPKPKEVPAPSKERSATNTREHIRTRRILRREQRGLSVSRSLSDGISLMFPKQHAATEKELAESRRQLSPLVLLLSDEKSQFPDSSSTKDVIPPQQQYMNNKNLAITRHFSKTEKERLEGARHNSARHSLDSSLQFCLPELISAADKDSVTLPLSSSPVGTNPTIQDIYVADHPVQVRGDPDGCGLDSFGRNVHDHVDVPNEAIVYVKKGWLLKEDHKKEWQKQWFVLRGTSLMFYRDPDAEDSGSCEGLLDMSQVKRIEEAEVDRNYGFLLEVQEQEPVLLSAITNGLRNSWMQALCKAAHLQEPVRDYVIPLGERIEKEMSLLKQLNNSDMSSTGQGDVPSSPRSGLSSDDEFKTASEASGRMEDYLELPEEDADPSSSSSRALPPSPPLNRTPISRVKERARTRSTRVTTQAERVEKRRPPNRRSSRQANDDFVKDLVCGGSDHEMYGPGCRLSSVDVGESSRKVGKSVASDVPESMLVGLLELEVESLKAQLQDAQNQLKHRCNHDTVDGKHSSYGDHSLVLKSESIPVDTDFDCPLSSWRQRMVGLEAQVLDLTQQLAEKSEEIAEKSDQLRKSEDGQHRHNDLLQRYHSLRNRLQQLETLATTSEREQALQAAYEQLESRYLGEKATWEDQSANLKTQIERPARSEIVEQLEERLEASEKKIFTLVTEMEDVCRVREKRVGVLHAEMQQREIENQQLRNRIQHGSQSQHSDVKRLEALLAETMATVKERDMTVQQCQSDVITLKAALDKTSGELVDVVDKLQKSTTENEMLRSKITTSGSNEAYNGSLAQDTTSELQSRLEKATQEIGVLKQSVKRAHGTSDELELQCLQLKQQLKSAEEDFRSQLHLMTVRVEDLTAKLSSSEKSNRQLKQKLSRQENKEQRRTRSLKGKEALTISKELELKLGELERKLCVVEKGMEPKSEEMVLVTENISPSSWQPENAVTIQVNDNTEAVGTPSYSLEDSLKLLARINTLESKVDGAAQKLTRLVQPGEKSTATHFEEEKPKVGCSEAGPFGFSNEKQPLPEPKDVNTFVDHCVELADWVSKRCTCSQHANWSLLGNRFSAARSLKVSTASKSLKSRVRALKDLQQQQDDFLSTKRTVLGQLGLLGKDTNLSIAADKLVHQSLLVGQMASLIRSSDSSLLLLERVREIKNVCCRWVLLMNALQRKEKKMKTSSAANFDKLLKMPVFAKGSLGRDFYEEMLKCEEDARLQIDLYKSSKKLYLASVLARKTLTDNPALSLSKVNVSKPSSDLTPDPLSQKLMETEMKRVVTRLQHIYEQDVKLELQTCSHLLHCPAPMAEERTNIVLSRLERDMGSAMDELFENYHNCLSQIQFEKKPCIGEEISKSEVMVQLAEYASVIGQHAILMGHTDYLRNNFFPSEMARNEAFVDQEEKTLLDEVLCQELDLLHSTEFSVRVLQSIGIGESFAVKGLQVSRWTSAQDILNTSVDGKPSYFLRSYEERAQRSFRQRGKRSVTMPVCSMVDTTTTSAAKKTSCADCAQSLLQIKAMREKHTQEQEMAKEKLEEVEKKWQAELEARELEHNTAISRLQEKLVNVERKRVSVRTECEQQIRALRETYGQEIAKKNDTKFNDESIRQRYQAEIEQLRGLCEKGLVAMENSHRRIVTELEEKHRQELEQLHAEKEQALAEETKATLAALDAMRKAHEAELQREIAKFKQEFFQKMQSSHEVTAHKEQDREELESIKHEIISLSNKYAQKCVEKASLEEHVQPLARQLSEANSLIFDLTARNKQLRARLKSSTIELQTYLGDESENDALPFKLQLQLKESELVEKQEVISDLQQQLQSTRDHEAELECSCRQLDESLKYERQVRQDEVKGLRDRLEHVIVLSNASLSVPRHHKRGERPASTNQLFESKSRSLSGTITLSEQDLARSSSCPGLSDDAISSTVPTACSLQVLGVVAMRKQLFEPPQSMRSSKMTG